MLNFYEIFIDSLLFSVLTSIFVLMRLIAHILILIFVAFLSAPTIVKLIDKKCDTSIFYGASEEEHAHKEVKVFVHNNNFPVSYFFLLEKSASGLILSENLSKHDKISATIFVPPPNFA